MEQVKDKPFPENEGTAFVHSIPITELFIRAAQKHLSSVGQEKWGKNSAFGIPSIHVQASAQIFCI
jgi:hypothetical protein